MRAPCANPDSLDFDGSDFYLQAEHVFAGHWLANFKYEKLDVAADALDYTDTTLGLGYLSNAEKPHQNKWLLNYVISEDRDNRVYVLLQIAVY